MRNKWYCNIVLINFFALLFSASNMFAFETYKDRPKLVAWWKFDAASGSHVIESISLRSDSVRGNFKFVEGVRGMALKLDGFTTQIRSKPLPVEMLQDAFTVEAWVALATYPWNWCPVVSQSDKEDAGFYFGVGPRGEVGLFASVNGNWQECTSEENIPLKKWVHIAAAFDRYKGVKIYIDGKLSGQLGSQGSVKLTSDADLLMGMNMEKVVPSDPVRTYATLPSWFSLDGICDEIKIYSEALSEKDINRGVLEIKQLGQPDIADRILPSGPAGPGRFGAYYTHLKYYEEWDALWRVGDHSDIVVQFDDSPVRVVFWRGTRYSPVWVMENGQWMADQSAEYFDEVDGCFEHMIDPHCLYSHVRIIENTEARVVIHWRYIPVSVRKKFSQVDEVSGWQDCVDEYFTFYPDGIGVRKVVEHSTGEPLHPSESIVLCQPGTTPEDNVHLDAMTLVNMKGESYTYSWANGAPVFRKGENPPDPVIQVVNLKSENKPFTIFEPDNNMAVFGIEQREDVSHFPWWNHWPVAQNPSDGRYCQAADRASHFSLAWGRPPYHKGDNNTFWYTWIYGASTESPEELAELARSWNNAPIVNIYGKGVLNKGYDLSQRAYIFDCTDKEPLKKLDIMIFASEESPMVNGCFGLRNISDDNIKIFSVYQNNKQLISNVDYRTGLVRTLEGDQLILWINKKSVKSQKYRIVFQP